MWSSGYSCWLVESKEVHSTASPGLGSLFGEGWRHCSGPFHQQEDYQGTKVTPTFRYNEKLKLIKPQFEILE